MQTAIVTGATSGIGRAIVEMLAKRGVSVIMPCRNLEKGAIVKQEIEQHTDNRNIEILPLDLLSLTSVHAFVQLLKERGTQIDFLINNAGAMFAEPLPTEDNIERTVATNYTSVFALTMGLLPLMAQNSVIVNTLSLMVRTAKIDRRIFEIPSAKKYARLKQYSRSKIALMYFTWELAHRLAGGAGGVAGDSLSAALGGLGVAGVDNVVDDGLSAALGGLGIAGADVAGAGYVGGVCNVVSNAVYNAVVKNIAVCAVDPGVVNTGIITMHKWYDPLADIFARPFFKTPQTATNITMRAIADKRNNFLYKGKSQKRPLPPLNKEFSEWLWNETVYALFDN